MDRLDLFGELGRESERFRLNLLFDLGNKNMNLLYNKTIYNKIKQIYYIIEDARSVSNETQV